MTKAKEDTNKIKTLYRLARAYLVNDSGTAFNYANKCFSLSKKINWKKGVGLSYYAKALVLKQISNYSASIQYATIAYNIFKSINSTKDVGSALINIGNCYEGTGFYIKAIENHLAALKLFESINDTYNIGVCYMDIGVNYYYLTQYDKAIDYYKKSLAIKDEGDKFGIGSCLDNIAIVYLDEGKYDSANIYDLKAIPYFIESNNLPGLGRIYGNRGDILMKLNKADSAYAFYKRSLLINTKLNITDGISTDYGDIGELYLDLAKDTSAKYTISSFMKMNKKALLDSSQYYLLKALKPDKEEGDMQVLMNHYMLLSEIEERLGNYKSALQYHKNYVLDKDSIFNDENKKKLAAMEIERLTEVKDQQIQLLNQQKALETSEVKRQTLIRNIIIASVFVAAILTFLFIFLYNRKRKTAFDKQMKEVEMKALRSQMNPHFIFNSLHSINKYVIENDKENASAYLSKFANLMRLILENSREQEVPLEKDLHALELYMQLEALRFKNKFAYSIETDSAIDKENTLIPPMLLQPFVENAIIHGVPNKENGLIKISVYKKEDMICCVVEDNGTGRENMVTFEQSENKTHKSLGMQIISERLNIINQIKKVKTAVNIFDLKDAENKSRGLRIELLLPFEPVF
ncbi:MAG TPA: tetratricopeptide repeat protein [Chitinophagaceae bacterium]|nr:tetratricopeptide repeat protein [Chitinophagaceae bacterium]